MLYVTSPKFIHLTDDCTLEHLPVSTSSQPLETTHLLCVSVNLAFFESTHKWDHTIPYSSLSVWLISLRIMPSGLFMLLQMARLFSFLWLNNIPLCVYSINIGLFINKIYVDHILFNYMLFPCLNCNTAVNTEVRITLQGSVSFSSDKYQKVVLLDHMCVLCVSCSVCLILCNLMDYGLLGSSVHRILQARILQWITISSSRGSSWPRDWTQVFCIAGRYFTIWATREGLGHMVTLFLIFE